MIGLITLAAGLPGSDKRKDKIENRRRVKSHTKISPNQRLAERGDSNRPLQSRGEAAIGS